MKSCPSQASSARPTVGLALTVAFFSCLHGINSTACAAEISLTNLEHTYDGTAKSALATMLPLGATAQLTYRDLSLTEPAAVEQTVFNNKPDVLDLSYVSRGLRASSIWAMAKFVRLGNTARKVKSCDVTLVTWAKASSYTTWSTANPTKSNASGWYHPITLSFFDYNYSNPSNLTWTFIAEKTILAFIPWRPLTIPGTSTTYPFNGYAFNLVFDFPDGVILPDDVWVSVGFNTSTTGPAPLNVVGPYDELNIPYAAANTIGTDLLPNHVNVLSVVNNVLGWRSQSTPSIEGPMLRLRTVPTSATITPPTNAGTYQVKAIMTEPGQSATASANFTIHKATATLTFSDLEHINNGNQKSAIVTTTPPGLATTILYNGSSTAPSASGLYTVFAETTNPNYTGQNTAQMRIGDTFATWLTHQTQSGQIDPNYLAPLDDPDTDHLPNLLEYASGLNPSQRDAAAAITKIDSSSTPGELSFVYRKNLLATDLTYTFEGKASLSDPLWSPLTPINETVIADHGTSQTIRARFPNPSNHPQYFLRLSVSE